ncbi:MAG: alpha/beta hydrolase [Micrococcus sp.]|nr:alpha/beta hydrolase [Micrococcus sp.]
MSPAPSARPDADAAPTPALSWLRRLRPQRPSRTPAAFTGHPARAPQHGLLGVPDPASGRATRMAVWDYAPVPAVTTGGTATMPDPSAGLPTLLFVHGFRGDHHGLQLLAEALPEFRIRSLDLPGFGESPAYPDAEHTVAHHADTVLAVLDALRAERPVGGVAVIAHSYGTIVAAHALVRDPRRARALALLNPIAAPALDASGPLLDRAMGVAAQGYYEAAARLPGRAANVLLRHPLITWATTVFMSKTDDARVLDYTHDQHRRYFSQFSDPRMLAQSYRASTTASVADVAGQLSLPVLLVAGARDPLGSIDAQQALHARIAEVSPLARLVMVPDVGHLLHYEKSGEAAAAIRQFLAALPASVAGPVPDAEPASDAEPKPPTA